VSLPLRDPAELATPAGTARALRMHALRPRKRFGQHFLVSRRVLDRLLEATASSPADLILEVGAGLGTLTAALAASGASIIAVEVDTRLIPILRATTDRYPNVRLVVGDVMGMDLGVLVREREANPDESKRLRSRDSSPPPSRAGRDGSLKIAANLPYGIASALIVRALESLPTLERAVITIQTEVAERILAAPGSKTYGALTVAVRYRADAARLMRIPPGAFYPPPEVTSTALRLSVLPRPRVAVADEALFFAVVRAAFGQRRKVLRNALTGIATGEKPLTPAEAEEACRRAGIDHRRRGETLTLEEFAALAAAVGAGAAPRPLAAAGGR